MAVDRIKIEPIVKRNAKRRYVLIAIVLAYLSVILFIPLGSLIFKTFSFGLSTVLEVFRHADVWHALRLTLFISAITVLLNGVFGIVIAWVLVRHEFPGKGILNAMVDLPFAVSPVVVGYMVLLLFGREGWLRPITDLAGINMLFSVPGMLFVTAFVSLPFVIREIMPLLEEMSIEQEEAAHTLGAGPWQTFCMVTLPSIRWGLLYGITLTFARALGEFGAVFIVSGAIIGQTETATLFVFRAMDERMYQDAYAVSLLLALISFITLLALEILKKRRVTT